jgi:hypothetical protein
LIFDLRRRAFAAVLALCFVAAAGAPGSAEPGTAVVAQADAQHGVLTGTVKTGGGTPLAGASVSAVGPTKAVATTRADGSFTFPSLPASTRSSLRTGDFRRPRSTTLSSSRVRPSP